MSNSESRLTVALAGRYRIERELGSGGMATVYLAEDVKHRRKVAIKVLHPELAAVIGAERFLKEIEVTAGLQHPHILSLFDSGEAGGQLFYVMPYVDGESLRQRLDREKQLPVADAIRIATEVAAALDYAHKRNIIHRDIKPENILLHDGSAVVADFGIALAVQQAGGQRMTQTGLSLGTPQYMSPEQAMGERTLDARTDIYALGAVTYEMFAGEPPFTGPNSQAIVARVLTEKPRLLSTLRETVAAQTEAAVHQALAKLPADRFATAAEFSRALQDSGGVQWSTGTTRTELARSSSRQVAIRTALPWAIATFAVVVAIAALTIGPGAGRGTTGIQGPVFAALEPREGETWAGSGRSLSVSPDGRSVVFAAIYANGENGLEIRTLDSLSTRALTGTSGAQFPFWSPDGNFIGFFAGASLRTIELSSGAVRTLCPSAAPGGGSWGADGTILYTPERAVGLHRTTASGGPCERLALRMPTTAALLRPYFFPDGKHFVATDDEAAWLGAIGDDSLVLLTNLERSHAVFAAPDILLMKRSDESRTLVAQRINVAQRRLVGVPVKIVEGVQNPGGHPTVHSSATGVLVAAVRNTEQNRAIGEMQLGESTIDTLHVPRGTDLGGGYRLSHDGRRIAFSGWEIAVMDIARRASTRVAINMAPTLARVANPAWSPLDTAIAYVTRDSTDVVRVDVVAIASRKTRTLFTSPNPGRTINLSDWSYDGRHMAFSLSAGGGATFEWWLFDLVSGEQRRLLEDEGSVVDIRFAPNGRLIAYSLNSGGGSEVYVRPFPAMGPAVRASTAGGRRPQWRGDGAELFYVALNGDVMSVQVRGDAPAQISSPQLALRRQNDGTVAQGGGGGPRIFDVSADGKRFYMELPSAERGATGLTLILDWWKLLDRDR